ncbi:glycosyltransferase [Nitratireductor sp. XY-223]|uniref:glycosyltransferase n=1 Tax=Nitratireductor sp. XY-223 TaxID=2561926 RepID=UPI0010AB4205|nr:glycosyltransferase [Nitratireductor sp. XY-223]
MRILHFYKTYWPDTFGGTERTINALAENTHPLGAEHHVLSLSASPSQHVRRHGSQTIHQAKRLFSIASTDISVDSIGKFRRLAKQSDIIHLHFPWPFMDPVYLAFASGKPAVLTYHSDALGSRLLQAVYAPMQHVLLSRVDAIVPTSQNYLETSPTLQRYRSKTTVIPLGIDAAAYPSPSRETLEKWRRVIDVPFFLFTGVLRHYKGLNNLLQAARALDLHVVIAGSGKCKDGLLAAKKKMGLENVHLIGAVGELDKIALLKLSVGFVFPSNIRSEAFGLALVEAAMMGKPLISCEIGTGTSYVNINGETGFIVPPNDPAALANAMLTLAENPELCRAFGKAAKQRYETLFRAQTMSQRYFELYKKILH